MSTEGQTTDIGPGSAVADVIGNLIDREFPAPAEGAGYDSFATLTGPPGSVPLRIFPDSRCSVA